jgi:CheY-specific phosphatase CheX
MQSQPRATGADSVENLSMEEEAPSAEGTAAEVCLTGEIEGRIIFDLDPQTAQKVASCMAAKSCPRPTIWSGKRSANSPTDHR